MKSAHAIWPRTLYPILLVLLTFLFFARPTISGEISAPLDTLGFMYPWNTQARTVFQESYPGPQQNGLLDDQLTVFSPFFLYARDQVRHGRLPLWIPYEMGGAPFLANDQSAVLYPINLLAFLLPVAAGLQAVRIVRVFGAGLGMYFFLGALGVRRPAAFLGAVAFMFSNYFVLWLGWSLPSVAMWLPWSFLCAEKIVQNGRYRLRWVAALATVTAMHLLAGHIETSTHILLALGIYSLCSAIGRVWKERHDHMRQLMALVPHLLIAGGVLLGVAGAAAQLIPTAHYLLSSASYELRHNAPPPPPQPITNVAFWFVPNLGGNPAYSGSRLFSDEVTYDRGLNFNERTGYVGILTLVLAALAFIHPRSERQSQHWAFVLLLVLSGCVVYGIPPLFGLAMKVSLLRDINNYRLLLIMAFALSTSAAIGMDGLLERAEIESWKSLVSPIWSRRIAVACIAVVGFFAIGSAFISKRQVVALIQRSADAHSPVTADLWVRAWVVFTLILLVLSWLMVKVSRRRLISLRYGVTMMVLLLIGDLFTFGSVYNPQVPSRYVYPSTSLTDTMRTLGNDARFVMGQDNPALAAPVLLPDIATAYNLRDLSAYDGIISMRAYAFMNAVNRNGPNRNLAVRTIPNLAPDYRLLAIGNVTHVLLPTKDAEPTRGAGHLVMQREDAADAPLPPLNAGQEVVQEFTAPTDSLSAIGFYLAPDRPLMAMLTFRLTDAITGATLSTQEILAGSDGHFPWLIISFPALTNSANRLYRASLLLHSDAVPGLTPTLYGTAATMPGTQRSLDGHPVSGTLRFRLYRATESSALVPIWHDDSHTLYAVSNARPRAYIADGVMTASDEHTALTGLDRLHVPGLDAVVESEQPLRSYGGAATISRDQPGDVIIRTVTTAAGILVLNEGFGDGGWTAEVDGKGESILHANYLYQAVAIPAGEHIVRFHYHPRAFTIGAAVSIAAGLGMLMLIALPPLLYRRRSRYGTPS